MKLVVEVAGGGGDVEVTLSGKALGKAAWGTPFPVDPGDYEVEATAPGRPQDPKGPANGTTRVHRGGSWNSPTTDFRCSSRSAGTFMTATEEIGFRCAK